MYPLDASNDGQTAAIDDKKGSRPIFKIYL